MAENIELSMTIILLNAAQHVEKVFDDFVAEMKKSGIKNFEIIPVINGCTDNTIEKVNEMKKKYKQYKIIPIIRDNIWYGAGMMAGLNKSKGRLVGYLWGNNKVPMENVSLIYKKIIKENLDLGKTKRTARQYSFSRRMQSLLFNKFFMILMFGRITSDFNGCPKIMKRTAFEKMKLHCFDSFFDAEIMVKAKLLKLKIGEVPTVYRMQVEGQKIKSFVKPTMLFEFLKNIFKLKFALTFRTDPFYKKD
ncbi:MAG: glycosyltransferase [archaeon]